MTHRLMSLCLALALVGSASAASPGKSSVAYPTGSGIYAIDERTYAVDTVSVPNVPELTLVINRVGYRLPMKPMFTKYAGPFAKLTMSHTRSSPTRSAARAGITYVVYERLSLREMSGCA